MKKIITLLLISIFLLISCDKKKVEEEKYLVVGTSPAFPPFEYMRDGEIVGFDIGLAEEIAKAQGKTLIVKSIIFDNLIQSLQYGEIDIILSGMTITDNRLAQVDFSNPYYEASQVIVVRKDDLDSFYDMRSLADIISNKTVGVELGSTSLAMTKEIVVAQNIESSNIVSENLHTSELVVMELLDGNVDAVLLDKEPAKAFMQKHDNIVELPITFKKEYYGVAVRKGDTEMLNSINKIINEMVASGVYNRLVQHYINEYRAN